MTARQQNLLAMDVDMHRRNFLNGSLGLAAGSTLISRVQAAEPQSLDLQDNESHCFINRSGDIGQEGFTLGMLVMDSPSIFAAKITQLRWINNYHRVLIPKSSDKYKFNFCKDIIKTLLDQQDAIFNCCNVVIDNWPDNPEERDNIVIKAHRSLFFQHKSRIKQNVKMHLLGRGAIREKIVSQALKEENFYTEKASYHSEYGSDILQFCKLLTNLCMGSPESVGNPKRIELHKFIREELKIDNFESNNLANHRVFRVATLRL